MKKTTVFLMVAMMAIGTSFAQKKNVVSAYNYLRKDKLAKAKEAIDPAITHEKTMGDAKTWYYYGNVYLSIHLTEEEVYKALDDNPLDKAYEAYLKAMELDDKEEFTDELNDRIQVCAQQYFNKGVSKYNEQAYKQAAEAFAKSADVNALLGSTDSAAIFYAAQSAYFGKELEEAKGYFNTLLEIEYYDPALFRMLADLYNQTGDTTAATQTLLDGRKSFPDDYNLIIDAANIYLATGQNQEALDVLNLAIEKDDTNATLFFAAGTVFDKTKSYDKAIEMYQSAININPEYFDANYNLGALYFNQAAEKLLEAGNLPLSEAEKYDALKADATDLMQKALPYLEKADSIQPADAVTLQTLKEIYTRLNMMEKLKGINERLGN